MSKQAIEAKSQIVDQIVENIENSSSLVLVSYQGITVEQDTKLRKQFREKGVIYKVLKNRLIKRAFNKLGYEQFDSQLEGTTAIAFGTEDMSAPAKILMDTAKDVKCMSIKSGLVDGTYLDVKGVEALAAIPSKEILIAKLLGAMQSPITGLAGVLNNTVASLPRVLSAIAEQKAE